jgi:hypothetical protein
MKNPMKKRKLIAAAIFLAPLLAFAQSPFDGTWLARLDSAQFPKKPEVYSLNLGIYSCSTCTPKINVKADGQEQKVTGDPYTDTLRVNIVDANTVEFTTKKDGKVVGHETDMISSDGKTLTDKFTDLSGTQPVDGQMSYTRIGAGPAGSHALSGSWRVAKLNDVSHNGLTATFQVTADDMKMSDPTGESYDAKFDGKFYPIAGDPGHSLISVKRVDANTIEATIKRQGKIVRVSTRTVSADGKSIKTVSNNKENGTTMSYVMEKQ